MATLRQQVFSALKRYETDQLATIAARYKAARTAEREATKAITRTRAAFARREIGRHAIDRVPKTAIEWDRLWLEAERASYNPEAEAWRKARAAHVASWGAQTRLKDIYRFRADLLRDNLLTLINEYEWYFLLPGRSAVYKQHPTWSTKGVRVPFSNQLIRRMRQDDYKLTKKGLPSRYCELLKNTEQYVRAKLGK